MNRRAAFDRLPAAVRGFWPSGWPGRILGGLLVAGLILRGFGVYAWSPTIESLADSWPYAAYAAGNPLDSPQHPAGYSTFLLLIGLVTREIVVVMVIQGLLGIATALLLYALTRRVTNSPWPGLFPAGIVLLGADQALLERTIMSETLFTFLIALSLYGGVRAIQEPDPWWRWPLATGLLAALSATVRTASTFLVAVIVLAILFARPRPWLPKWKPVIAAAAAAGAILVAYAAGNTIVRGSFELGPSQGWHLYLRAATFADCSKFTPPAGTEGLCETKPVSERYGGSWYIFSPESPVVREFGSLGGEDELVGEWARRAILSDLDSYLNLVWRDFRAFFVPSSHAGPLYGGHNLDPTLDWSVSSRYNDSESQAKLAATEAGIEQFFNDFDVHRRNWALEVLHDYQRVFRFGATALTVCTLLSLLGLLIGSRNSRVSIFLLAGGSIALLVPTAIGGIYVGRYTVPLAGPMIAAAAIAVFELVRLERRRAEREQRST